MDELTTPGSTASIEVGDEDGVPVVRLLGELDIASAERAQPILEALGADRPERVIVDVSGLEFMDSSGIALLLGLAAKVGRLEVRSPSRIVRQVIEMTGLADTLVIVP